MKIAGVVAEYNSFHAGHRHHLEQTRARLGECAVAAVMSGNFVQRGDCAVTDKWERAAAALEGGADLVLELPTVWACASAEAFARGAVAILQAVGAQALSFGSESGDAAALARAAQALDSADYRLALRGYLDQGCPLPGAGIWRPRRCWGGGGGLPGQPQRQPGGGVPPGRPASGLCP